MNNLFDCQTLSLSSRAELDATHVRPYGLTRDELRYILDTKEVHGEDPSILPTVAGRVSLAKLSTW